ncbi:MAG: hypothetical protein HQK84_07085 [Nitrospinae bacterium]|nr:hypothetical protein [Nitrospinota bacterium]
MKNILVFSLMLFLFSCTALGQKEFDRGNQLYMEGQLEESVYLLKKAYSLSPSNKEFLERLEIAQKEYVKRELEKVYKDYKGLVSLNPEVVALTDKRLENLLLLADNQPEVKKFKEKYLEERALYMEKTKEIKSKIEYLYEQGSAALFMDEVDTALNHFEQLYELNPDYKDVKMLLEETKRKYIYDKSEEVKKLIAQEKYKNAGELIEKLQEVAPEDQRISELKDLLRYRDSYYYNFQKAENLLKQGLIEPARESYLKALTYNPEDPNVKQKLFAINQKFGDDLYLSGKRALILGDLVSANVNFIKAMNAFPEIKSDKGFKKAIAKLKKKWEAVKTTALNKKMLGLAYAVEEKINQLMENSNDDSSIKKKIIKELTLKLGLMAFEENELDGDNGNLFADYVYADLLKEELNGVEAVNREIITPVLVKDSRKKSGFIDSATLSLLRKKIGIDFILTGKILFLDLKSVDTPQLSLKKVPLNVERATDLLNPEEQQRQLESQKMKIIEVKSGKVKKECSLSIIYILYDAATGEKVYSDSLDKKHFVEDSYSDGFESEGIVSDPLEIGSDKEVVADTIRETVHEMLKTILGKFSNPGNTYLARALQQEKISHLNGALLSLVKAKFLLPETETYKVESQINLVLQKILSKK